MNLAIWDIESSSAITDFGSIIEIGGILVDENFKEKDRFNLRCRLPEGEIPDEETLPSEDDAEEAESPDDSGGDGD